MCEDKGKIVGVGGLYRVWFYIINMVFRIYKVVVEFIRKVI